MSDRSEAPQEPQTSTNVRLDSLSILGEGEQREVCLLVDDGDGSQNSAEQPLGVSAVTVVSTGATGEPSRYQIAVTREMTAQDAFRLALEGFEVVAPFDLARDIRVTHYRVIRIAGVEDE